MFALVLVVGVAVVICAAAATRYPLGQIAFVIVGLYLLVITWNGLRFAGGAAGNGLFVLAVLAVFVHAAADRRPIRIPPWLLATAAILVVSALITAAFPPSPLLLNRTLLQFVQMFVVAGAKVPSLFEQRSNTSALLKWEVGLLLLPIIISVVATTPWRVSRLLDLWTLSTVINGAVGVLDYGGLHFLAASPIAGHRSSGLTLQPNYLALTCVFGIPTAARLIGRSRRQTLIGGISVFLLVGGEFATGSRDGTAAAAIVLVLCVAFLPRLRPYLRFALPIIGIALTTGLAFTSLGHGILQQVRLGGVVSTNGSDYQRSVFAHVAETQIRARPLSGIGFSVDNDAQNIYLQILAAGGAIAMAAFVTLMGGCAACVYRARTGPLREDAIAIGIAVAGWVLNGYYDAQIADKYLYVMPGLLIACAYVTRNLEAAAAAPPDVAGEAPPPPRAAPIRPRLGRRPQAPDGTPRHEPALLG